MRDPWSVVEPSQNERRIARKDRKDRRGDRRKGEKTVCNGSRMRARGVRGAIYLTGEQLFYKMRVRKKYTPMWP